MKNLQMPHSYISVSEEELRSISGGGPLGDALDLFFSNLRLDDLFFSGGLISLSFTFVPMLGTGGSYLGFVTGTPITVLSSIGGNVIVNVKDSRVAINEDMARHIMI